MDLSEIKVIHKVVNNTKQNLQFFNQLCRLGLVSRRVSQRTTIGYCWNGALYKPNVNPVPKHSISGVYVL